MLAESLTGVSSALGTVSFEGIRSCTNSTVVHLAVTREHAGSSRSIHLRQLGEAQRRIQEVQSAVQVLFEFNTRKLSLELSLSELDCAAAAVHAKDCYTIMTRSRQQTKHSNVSTKIDQLMEGLYSSLRSALKLAAEEMRTSDIITLVTVYPSIGAADEGIKFVCEHVVHCVSIEVSNRTGFLRNKAVKEIPFLLSQTLRFLEVYYPSIQKHFTREYTIRLLACLSEEISNIIQEKLTVFVTELGNADLDRLEIDNVVLIARACNTFWEDLHLRTRSDLNDATPVASFVLNPLIQGDVDGFRLLFATNEIRLLREHYNRVVRREFFQQFSDLSQMQEIFYILEQSVFRAYAAKWPRVIESILFSVCEILEDLYNQVIQVLNLPASKLSVAVLSEIGERIIQGTETLESFLSHSAVSQRLKISVATQLVKVYGNSLIHQLENFDKHLLGSPHIGRIESRYHELRKSLVPFQQLSYDLTAALAQDSLGLVKQIFNDVILTNYVLSDKQFELAADSKSWAQPLLWICGQFSKELICAYPVHSCSNWVSNFLEVLMVRLSMTLELSMLGRQVFNQLGVLLFERELRVLVAGLSNLTQTNVRNIFSRLLNACRVLSVDSINDIADYWDHSSHCLLAFNVDEAVQILCRRVDFTEVLVREALDKLSRVT